MTFPTAPDGFPTDPIPTLPPADPTAQIVAAAPGIIDALARWTHGHHDRAMNHTLQLIEALGGAEGYRTYLADRRAHDLAATDKIFTGLDELLEKIGERFTEAIFSPNPPPADVTDVTPPEAAAEEESPAPDPA